MAHTAYFKFPDAAIDVVPAALDGDLDSATLKDYLVELYTNRGGEASCGTGKIIFGNYAGDINAPVLLVRMLLIQYVADAGTDFKLVFHLMNLNEFRIAEGDPA